MCDLLSDAVVVGYQNDNWTGKAVNEIGRGILRSGKFSGATKKFHTFPQQNDRRLSQNCERIPAEYISEDI